MQTKRKSLKKLKRKVNTKSKKQIGGSGLNAQLAALLSGKAKISNSRPEPINEDEIKALLIDAIGQNKSGIYSFDFPEKFSKQKDELKAIIKGILNKSNYTEKTDIQTYSHGAYNFSVGNANTYSFYALRTMETRDGDLMKIKEIPRNNNDVDGVVIRRYNIRNY